MTDELRPEDKIETSAPTDGKPATHYHPDPWRRRLTKAGLTAPLILTIASRPVWAMNCTESGMMSGNLSEVGLCGGEGLSPGFWQNHTDQWHPNYPPDAEFNLVFGVDAWPTGTTLLEVIDHVPPKAPSQEGIDGIVPDNCTVAACQNLVNQLGFHSVAALQNAATSVSFDFTVDQVIQMFLEAYTDGTQRVIEALKDDFEYVNNQSLS